MKAIETEYKGYKMRSRLEAKWAMVFDLLDLPWHYEPEGFTTDDGNYLPDFYLDNIGWIEIKPRDFEDDKRHYAFAKGLNEQQNFFVIRGDPGVEDAPLYEVTMLSPFWDNPFYFCECPTCGVIDIQYDGRSARNKHKPDCEILRLRKENKGHPVWGRTDDKVYNFSSPRLTKAFDTARTFRFPR